jgi:hypothetical protein
VPIITRLNGRDRDRGSTSGMIHDCYAVVSGISKYCTLQPLLAGLSRLPRRPETAPREQ